MEIALDRSLPPLPSPEEPTEAGPSAPRRRPLWLGLVVFVAMIGSGMLVGGLIGRAAKASSMDLTRAQSLATLAGILASLPLVLALHELGHLLGGWLAGFRFNLFIVGPLKIIREGDGVRVRLNTNLSIAGGLAGCSPVEPGDHRRGMILMVAGGPLVSLLGALAGLLGAYAFGVFQPGASGWGAFAGLVLGAFGLTSLAIGMITLVPGRTSGFMTDGARLLGLLRNGGKTDREIAVIGLVAESATGRRPRDWDESLVTRSLSVPDGSLLDAVAEQLAYVAKLDRGDLAAARDHLARALALADRLPVAIRPAIELEAAIFEATRRVDAVAARRWLDRAGTPGGLVPRHLRPTAEAALAIVEHRPADALPRIETARSALARTNDPGVLPVSRDLLDALEHRARQAQSSPQPEPEAAGALGADVPRSPAVS